MKKKFILLALMCLTLFGGVKWNVLNAQEQWYRIKALRYQEPGNWGATYNYDFTTDMYLNIDNYDAHVEGPIGGVSVASYSESLDQIFTLEDNGDGTYYIKSASGKYIYCQSWNVDALDTKSPIGIEYIDANTFYMKNTNVSKYFKVEYVDSAAGYYPFCDYGNTSYAATWVLEETTIEYTVNVTVSSNEIWSDETVQLSATAINGAGNYSYSWSPATGLNDATSATPIFTPTAAGTYTFTCTATDADGATATSEEITITVKDASERPKTRNIVFTLKDSYGDGWNGNYLQISYNGEYVYTLTNEDLDGLSYTQETQTIVKEIPEGTVVQVVYVGTGSYQSENTYRIYYEDGTLINGESEIQGTGSYSSGYIVVEFTIESSISTVEVSVESIVFGDVRMGEYWSEREETSFNVRVEAKNGAEIETITSTDDFFKFGTMYPAENSVDFTVRYDKNGSAGVHNGNMVITYIADGETLTKEIPMSATAYVPAQGDVIENPIEVAFDENGSYSNTPTFSGLYDDYILPDEALNEGNNPDAVYKLVLEDKSLVTATLNVGAWMAIYNEDFNGVGGPKADNAIATGLNNTFLSAGTYYVLLATNGTFTFTMAKTSVPAPTITYSNPNNESANNDNPLLQWDMQYAEEYQLLFGTDAQNLDVVVDWTEELAYSYQTSELQNNTKYCWQVKAKNESGTTTGKVQSFVTLLDVPQITSATSVNLYQGETATITWNAVTNASSYTVYNGYNVLATLEATETSYELSGLEYNMAGHNITVTATQEGLGESLKSTAVIVKVAGSFPLTVNVTDGNGNAIEGATVTVNTTYAYDEFGEQVASMEPQTTDVEGKVILFLPLLGNYSYYTILASKSPYAEQSTTVSTAYGTPSSRDLTLYLPSPSNLYPENEEYMLLVGEDLTLNWTAAEGAISYNVYKQGEYNNSTWTYEYDLLGSATENTYTTVAEYDGEGSYYAVSAVFEGGLESEKTSTNSRIYVLGTGDVKGLVTDQNGNPVAGAALELSGTTGFGEKNHISETETDGTFYFEDVIEGNYTLTVMHNDYQAVEPLSDITVGYNNIYEIKDPIILTAKPEITGVTVTADNNGNVSWTGDYAKYNVYRKNIETPQELESVATAVTTTSATDAQWETLEPGTYQYGVAALVEQQSSEIVEIINEGFEDNKIPNTWYKYKENIDANSGAEWVTGTRLPNSSIYVNNNCGSYFAYSAGKSYDGNKYHLVTPKINASGCVLSFYYAAPLWGSDKCTLEVLYSSNQEGPWNSLGWSVEGVSSWTYAEIDLSSIEGSFYISFCVTDKWGYGVALDNVSIKGNTLVLDETQPVWSNEVEKQGPATFVGEDTENPTAWDVAANWSTGVVPADGAEVTIAANALISSDVNVKNLTINTGASLTVATDGALTVTGTIDQASDYLLILEEGGQIFQNNPSVTARFRMSIDKPTEWSNTANKDGWQFISMPMTDVTYDWFTGADSEYDLYKYDGSQDLEWLNHKASSFAETEFISGIGYLASLIDAETATVYGTLNAATSKTWGQYYVNNDKDLANFRLLGNPFTFDMDMTKLNSGGTMVTGYAIVNANGEYEYKTNGTVKVGEGFFVKVATNYASLIYNHNIRSAKSESCNSLNLIATGAEGSDNVIINLAGAENEGFNKLQNFNEGIANIFVAKNDIRYGIANFDSDVTMVDVAFEAKEMGNYTIAAQPDGKFETLTLVDRFTGVETNLLIEDYHFTATSRDDYNRFIVKLKVNGQQSIDNSQFAYQSGEDLILNIEGKVQIIDMMGRVVYSNDVTSANNRINVSDFNNAAYLIRVVNEEGVKVQKLIVNSL